MVGNILGWPNPFDNMDPKGLTDPELKALLHYHKIPHTPPPEYQQKYGALTNDHYNVIAEKLLAMQPPSTTLGQQEVLKAQRIGSPEWMANQDKANQDKYAQAMAQLNNQINQQNPGGGIRSPFDNRMVSGIGDSEKGPPLPGTPDYGMSVPDRARKMGVEHYSPEALKFLDVSDAQKAADPNFVPRPNPIPPEVFQQLMSKYGGPTTAAMLQSNFLPAGDRGSPLQYAGGINQYLNAISGDQFGKDMPAMQDYLSNAPDVALPNPNALVTLHTGDPKGGKVINPGNPHYNAAMEGTVQNYNGEQFIRGADGKALRPEDRERYEKAMAELQSIFGGG